MSTTINDLKARLLDTSGQVYSIAPSIGQPVSMPTINQITGTSLKQGLEDVVRGSTNPVTNAVENTIEKNANFILDKIHGVFGDFGLFKISIYVIVISFGLFSFFKTIPGEKVIHIKGGKK